MYLAINNNDITDFVAYQGFKWSRNDVDGPSTGRNLQGRMIRDRVATKIRLDITCRLLTGSEHMELLNLLMPEFITVEYDDPQAGRVQKTMYSNNHSSGYCIKKQNGTEYWHEVSFPLIER